MTPMQTRILLVDDHQIVREGLGLMLSHEDDLTVVASHATAEAAWSDLEQLRPAIVVADYELSGENGVELAQRIQTQHPAIRVVMLSGHAEVEVVNAALMAGVAGYVLKLNASTELLAAIRAVSAGKVYLSPDVSSVLVREYRQQLKGDGPAPRLSEREREVLRRIADGQPTKEIAFALRVSPKTVDAHRLNLFAKLGARSVAELTKYAIREGITTL